MKGGYARIVLESPMGLLYVLGASSKHFVQPNDAVGPWTVIAEEGRQSGSGGNLVKMIRLVRYKGKLVRLVVAVCG